MEDQMEDQMDDLVKFVTVGSPIVKTKGLVLYRPTAIIPSFVSHSEKPGEIDRKTRKVPKITLKNIDGFFPPSGVDKDAETSTSGSNSSCSSDSKDGNNSGDDESVESDMELKFTSLDFSFY